MLAPSVLFKLNNSAILHKLNKKDLCFCYAASFFALLLLLGCGRSKQEVDLLIHNAKVYTVDAEFKLAEALAVRNGKILEVGSSNEIAGKYKTTNSWDASGQTIVPGLIDAHCHFYGLGLNQQVVDLVGTTSFAEVLEKIFAFQQKNHFSFVRGRGWDQNDWPIKQFPTRKKLDSLFPDTPVILERIDGHAYLVNQKALQMADITAKGSVPGGEVVVDVNGKQTGVLIDAPMAKIDAIIPQPDKEAQIKDLKVAEKICFSYGLTTVNDAGLNRATIDLIDSLHQAGDLQIRIYAMLSNNRDNLDYYLKKGISKTERLNIRSVKVYGDGALGSRGAALKAPYSDKPGHYGAMVTPINEIEAVAKKLAESDFQMNTHAIGDSSNAFVLRTYKKVLQGKKDRRWKIEHAQVVAPQDFDYFEHGIIPSIQPTHATSDMYWAKDRLGAERIKGAYAYKTLLQKAGLLALGTDFPVEQVSPFLTFYAAVSRQDQNGYPENGFFSDQRLSREETLKGMTIWAAYSNFEEGEKGSLEPGKWADFTVLSEDIMQIPVQKIPNVQAIRTYVGGQRVH